LQEEEGEDGVHTAETVGYIAVEAGGDTTSGTAQTHDGVNHTVHTLVLGDTFDDAVVLAETQTINGGNTATVVIDSQDNDTVDLFVEEEQSNDSETTHIDETIGVVAFEDGLIPCFAPGAMIETPYGPRPVQTLTEGDMVLTRDHGPCPIRWVSHTILGAADLSANPNDRPIHIAAGAIAPGIPERDLIVSPQHRFLIEGWKAQIMFGQEEVLVPAKSFINDHSVRVLRPNRIEYFHLLLDNHAVIRANGAWTESLHAGELDKAILSPSCRDSLFRACPDLPSLSHSFGPLARPSLTVREGRLIA
ncbi:MAG: Hint domain-containing protein, partial [Rhodobacteraceae bacterium]|nr:Hint domain-containing protein [Paracoccaceae bacterium]